MDFKNIISKLNKFFKNNIYYYLSLALILLAYDINLYLNILLYGLLIINLSFNLDEDKFLYSFIPLVFFESHVYSNLIISPFMLSSLIKVYYIMFAFRVVLDILKKKKFNFDISALALTLLFALSAFSYAESIGEGTLYILKTAVIVLYIVNILKSKDNRQEKFGELLSVIAFSSFICGVFALVYGVYWDNRLCSTIHDPNYSSLIYSIGLFASFAATKFKKYIKIGLSIALAGFLGLTMSITGFLITFVLLAIYMLKKFGPKRVLLLFAIIIILLSSILFIPSEKGGMLNRLQTRINKFYVINETDFTLQGHDNFNETQLYLNYITNNRYYLNKAYSEEFSDLPIKEQLFGGNNIMSGPKRDELEGKIGYVSHNCYLDMIFMIGIIPTLLILLCILLKIISLIKEYLKNNSDQLLCFIFIKLLVLGIGLTISMFPYRYFILFILL